MELGLFVWPDDKMNIWPCVTVSLSACGRETFATLLYVGLWPGCYIPLYFVRPSLSEWGGLTVCLCILPFVHVVNFITPKPKYQAALSSVSWAQQWNIDNRFSTDTNIKQWIHFPRVTNLDRFGLIYFGNSRRAVGLFPFFLLEAARG